MKLIGETTKWAKEIHRWGRILLCGTLCMTAFTACSELEDLMEEDDDEIDNPTYVSPYEEYDSTATAMILKPQTKPTEGLYGTGEADNPYLIRNAPELRYFINAVSDGSLETSGKYFKLMNDITVYKTYSWYPIGAPQTFKMNAEEIYTFYGAFDGNGHTIKGTLNLQPVHYSDGSKTSFGLFASIGITYDEYSVKDLTIDADVNITGGAVSNSETLAGAALEVNVGILASRSSNGSNQVFRNCHIHSDVKFTHDWRIREMRIGGFCATATWSEFHDCSFSGSIDMGGRVAAGSIEVGGIVGAVSERIRFENCVNNADIKADGITCVQLDMGGICGDYGMSRRGGDHFWFINCRNTGNLSSDGIIMQMANNSILAGGIVGQMWESLNGDERVFADCENSGNITFGHIQRGDATSDEEAQPWYCIGGIVGQSLNGFSMERCINTGNVTAGSTDFGPYAESYTGGIGGYLTASQGLTECRSTGDVTGMVCPESVMNDEYTLDNYPPLGVTRSRVGGLAGEYGYSPVHGCYTEGNITGTMYCDEGYTGTLFGAALFYAGVEPFIYSCTSTQAAIDGKLFPDEYILDSYVGNSKFVEQEHYLTDCGGH